MNLFILYVIIMANRYFLSWNRNTSANRSTTSWWAWGAWIPTSSDDVFFDNNSWNCTQNATTATCRNINFTGYTNTVTTNAWTTINILGSFTGAPTATITWAGWNIQFTATSWSYNVDINWIVINHNMVFWPVAASTAVWDMVSGFNCTVSTYSVSIGWWRLNFNNHTHNVGGIFVSFNTNTRTVDFGTSTINMYGHMTIAPITNLTLIASTCTLNVVWILATTVFNMWWQSWWSIFNKKTTWILNLVTSSWNLVNTLGWDPNSTTRFSTTSANIINVVNPLLFNWTSWNNCILERIWASWTWYIDKTTAGAFQIQYATISNSFANDVSTFYANNSTDSGWNTNWIFWPASITWQISKVFFM